MEVFKKTAIIVAGGKGRRLPGNVPKQFLSLAGIPMLMRTVMAFRSYDPSIGVILVLPETDFKLWDNLCRQYDFMEPLTLVAGGETRYESVRKGMEKVAGPGYVAVHDGVRPLVTSAIIALSFEIARRHKTAVASVALKESIRELIAPPSAGSTSQELPSSVAVDRSKFRSVQTPQTFDIDLLKSAYTLPEDESFTDDASVVQRAGHAITLFEGSYENLKITTPVDLVVAEAILKTRGAVSGVS